MNILDLFCCQGGASFGYGLAGATVVGVDNNPDNETAYRSQGATAEFVTADWRKGLDLLGDWADFIHASPPCQGYSVVRKGTYGFSSQERLIPEVRDALNATGKPWVIENVSGALKELRAPLMLTGDMFRLGATIEVGDPRPWFPRNPGGKGDRMHQALCPHPRQFEARIHRVRYFEFGSMSKIDAPTRDREWMKRINLSITNGSMTDDFHRLGHRDLTITQRQDLLGIRWNMTKLGLAESIPPAYTKYIGERL